VKHPDRYKDIQLGQLRSFCVVGIEGNFSTAAQILSLSTSTVWQQVRALERELKVTLLRRQGRQVELTPDGKLLLGMVQPHVSGLDSLRHFFEARREELPHEMIVASGAYLLANHLPEPVRVFRDAHPTVRVSLRVASWSHLHRMIGRREADVAVLACDPEGSRFPHVQYEHLFDEPFCLLTPTGHPLARPGPIAPRELVEYSMIVPPPGGVDRRTLDRLLQRHDLVDRVQTAMVSGYLDVTKKYVVQGIGIALAYLPTETDPPMAGLNVRALDPEMDVLPIMVAVRKGEYLPGYVEDFRRVVLEHLSARGTASGSPDSARSTRPGPGR
jgi:DNA-binding transcriptional LysR family regulator